MKKILQGTLVCLFLLLNLSVEAQMCEGCDGMRYKTQVFNNVDVDLEVQYGNALQPTIFNPNATTDLGVDIYQPVGDTLCARPLIIWAFGGAFVVGTSLSPDIVTLCNRFTEMGYVNASIDYRLSPDLLFDNSNQNAYEAVMLASHDLKAAVRFFYKDAATTNTYKIDTNRIYVGGVSAGGIAAVHVAYLDDLNEVPGPIYNDFVNNGGIEGNSGNPGYSSKVAGVINLCGAILDTTWMVAGDAPIVSLHGTNDGTVPYDNSPITLLGVNLLVAGSEPIHQRADNLGIDNDLYLWQGAGHTPFVSDGAYMDTTVWVVRDFLAEQVCKVPVTLNLKTILEGAHTGTGTMTTDLNAILPLTTPYAIAPYNAPNEIAASIPPNAVDWVLVEVRTGTPTTSAPKGTQMYTQKSAFLLDDGSIVDLDGVSPITIDMRTDDDYHIVVRHRNHLDVMSSNALMPINRNITYDFRTGVGNAYGNFQLKMDGGFSVMYSGDISPDHTIQTTDFDIWRINPALIEVYDFSDTNMDRTVQTTDFDEWFPNKAKVGSHEVAY